MKNVYLLLLYFVITSCVSNKTNKPTSLSHEDRSIIDYLFSDFEEDGPGASVLVIKEGKIVHKANYGVANLDINQPITSNTNFRIASVTKQFTAMAIMILEHQGKLSFETKLTEVFTDFPDYGKDINIRHLLSNQSGIVDYYGFIDEERIDQYLDAEILDSLYTVDSTCFFPGTQYQYSNTGYAVLSQVIEKVSGVSFEEFMQKEIFEKIGMANTQVFQLDQSIKSRAYGHSVEKDSTFLNDQSQTSTIQGDGGIYSNVMDYYKWDQALYTDKLIPAAKLEDAFSNWDNNQKNNEDGYGYGWYVDYSDDIKILNHSGGTAGFQTRVSRIPSLELTIVLFSNHDGHDRGLMHKVNGLKSIYSVYKIPMPMEIPIKKEMDQKGIAAGIEVYDQLKNDERFIQDKTTLNYLGFEYRRIQKVEEAEALFIKAIQVRPNYFGGYYGLGHTYKISEPEKAILNFKKVIELGTEGEDWMIERSNNLIQELSDQIKGAKER